MNGPSTGSGRTDPSSGGGLGVSPGTTFQGGWAGQNNKDNGEGVDVTNQMNKYSDLSETIN